MYTFFVALLFSFQFWQCFWWSGSAPVDGESTPIDTVTGVSYHHRFKSVSINSAGLNYLPRRPQSASRHGASSFQQRNLHFNQAEAVGGAREEGEGWGGEGGGATPAPPPVK